MIPYVKNGDISQPSQTDWDRVDRIQDQAINLSDLPEISSAKFAQAIIRKGLQPINPTSAVR